MNTKTPRPAGARDLSALMKPASVAILGASQREEALSNRVIRNLIAGGYTGRIYPVHPKSSEVEGLVCYPDLGSLPQVPDCVAVALSADKVMAALEEVAQCGARAAVLFASGFAELGESGRRLQADVAALCARTGLVVCGPNGLGLSNVHDRFSLYSAPLPHPQLPGQVAIASHSGSACVALSSTGRFGLSYVVSVGNAAVLDVEDYLHFFADDPRTRIACLFLESVRQPERFAAAAARMRAAGKPVVVLKVGRSELGAAASAAHTGSLAGSHAVACGFLQSCGVIVVNDMDEMVETCVLMERATRRPGGTGVAVINVSGGEVALTCDLGQELGLAFPPLAPDTANALRACLPSYATPSNPLDATGTAVTDPAMYGRALEALLTDPGVSLVAVSQDCPVGLSEKAAANYRRLAQATAEVARNCDKPIVFYSNVGGGLHAATIEPLAGSGVAALQGARTSLLAIRHFLDWHRWQARAEVVSAQLPTDPAWAKRLAGGQPLSEHEAKNFLQAHGVRTTREARASSAREAADRAAAIGFPVVMKIDSADIAHKTEAGGVRLSLKSHGEVQAAFEEMLAQVHERAPAAYIDGVLLQEMVSGGIEMIAGISRQPPFGLASVVGSGGVFVELVRDSSLALGLLDRDAARALVEQTRAARLLDGFRGGPPADRASFEDLVVHLSRIAHAYSEVIEAIDLNPVAVLPRGQGCCVLDALIIPRHPANSICKDTQ